MNRVEYNFDLLSEKMTQLVGALQRDAIQVLRNEVGQLAGNIGDSVGPKTQAKVFARIERDIKQHLTIYPVYSNLDDEQQYSSTADFTWLEAGPNFLLGINDEDNQVKASGQDALEMLRAGQRSGSRGGAYEQLGRRGHQSVQRLNRIRVSKSSFGFVRRELFDRVGELRASFYAVSLYFIPGRRVPNWILARIEQVKAKGKTRTNDAGLHNPLKPFIEFTIRAPGVESNPIIENKIKAGINTTIIKLSYKLKKVLDGYSYNWKNGAVFKAPQTVIEA